MILTINLVVQFGTGKNLSRFKCTEIFLPLMVHDEFAFCGKPKQWEQINKKLSITINVILMILYLWLNSMAWIYMYICITYNCYINISTFWWHWPFYAFWCGCCLFDIFPVSLLSLIDVSVYIYQNSKTSNNT